jgi:LCP family protein required for cell wall assembly
MTDAEDDSSAHSRPDGTWGPLAGLPRAGSGRRVARAVAVSTAAIVLLGGAGLGFLYYRLDGNLRGIDINALLGRDRPDDVDNGSTDVLVLGSDSRKGTGGAYGADVGAPRSDTAMILHIHRGHRSATVVSIPRDTLVTRPECPRRPGSGTAPARKRVMFNTAYAVGGPACAVKTVERMSGIRMDHYLEVDFTGFKTLVDKLGGVPVTAEKPIKDSRSRLDLEPGRHTLDGEQALGLVRTRHAVGDGSDLGRIQLQQTFVRSLIEQVAAVDLYGDPGRLYSMADTATQALTTDSDLASVNRLVAFGKRLKHIGSQDMRMVTLPVTYDAIDPNRVVPVDARCRQVWDALRKDRPVPASATDGAAGGAADTGDVLENPS